MQRSFLFGLAALVAVTLIMPLYGCSDDRAAQPPDVSGQVSPQAADDVRMLEEALAKDPNNLSLLVQTANRYYDIGVQDIKAKGDMAQPADEWDKAIGYYHRALEIDPNNVDVRTDMANLIQWLGRTDEAISEYRMGKQINPKHPQTRTNLIILLAEGKKDYKGAVREYEELIAAIPEEAGNPDLKKQVDQYRELAKGQTK